jgi:hypothetical protein
MRPIEASDEHHNSTSDHERSCAAAALGGDCINSVPDSFHEMRAIVDVRFGSFA